MRKAVHKQTRAFSMVEMVTVLALFVIILGIGLTSQPTNSSGPRLLAEQLAAEFRVSRQQAMAHGRPTALVFSSQAGHQSNALRVSGFLSAESRQVIPFSDYKNCYSFVGRSQDSQSTTPLERDSAIPLFPLQEWLGDFSKNFCFVYLPDGTLVTNGLPNDGQAYQVLTSQAFDSSADSASDQNTGVEPANNYRLERANAPWSVRLTSSGGVSIEKTAPQGFVPRDGHSPQGALMAAQVTSDEPSSPDIQGLEFWPQSPPELLPPGIAALVHKDSHLTLEVAAIDIDGEPMTATWSATPVNNSKGEGSFSTAGLARSRLDLQTRQWSSRSHWAPPPDAVAGDTFRISCTVTDEGGRTDSATLTASSTTIQIIETRIIFLSNRPGNNDIFEMNPDGSGQKNLTRTPGLNEVDLKLAPQSNRLQYATGQDQVYVLDLSTRETLGPYTGNYEQDYGAGIAPSGRYLFFNCDCQLPSKTLAIARFDDQIITKNTGVQAWNPVLTPDEQFMVFSNGTQIYRANFNPDPASLSITGKTALTNSAGQNTQPTISHDGQTVYFTSTRDGNAEIYQKPIFTGPGDEVNLSNSPSQDRNPCLSPDGTFIGFETDRTGDFEIFRMGSDGSSPTNLSRSPGSDESNPCWGL